MNVRQVRNSTIKSLGRQMLKGSFFKALVFLVISRLMSRSVPFVISELFPTSAIASGIGDAYFFLIKGPLCFAEAIFFLWMFRSQPVGLNSFVHGFEYFRKDLMLYIGIFLRCFLWGLLFFIPGVICFVRCSQAFYILADDPTKTPRQCIDESHRLMQGNGGRFCSLCISYVGWFILSMLPQMFVLTKSVEIPLSMYEYEAYIQSLYAVQSSPLVILTEVFIIMAEVYFLSGTACFYDIVSGKLVFRTDTCEENVQ